MALNKDDVIKKAVVFSDEDIQKAWQKSELNHLQLVSTNKKYRALPKEIWDSILAEHLSIHKYIPEFFDCDSYSSALMGMVAFDFEVNGIARVLDTSASHSYNAVLVLNDDKTCSWQKVEPQADIFVEDPPKGMTIVDKDKMYKAERGFAITA